VPVKVRIVLRSLADHFSENCAKRFARRFGRKTGFSRTFRRARGRHLLRGCGRCRMARRQVGDAADRAAAAPALRRAAAGRPTCEWHAYCETDAAGANGFFIEKGDTPDRAGRVEGRDSSLNSSIPSRAL
jgi:hypothetical protein